MKATDVIKRLVYALVVLSILPVLLVRPAIAQEPSTKVTRKNLSLPSKRQASSEVEDGITREQGDTILAELRAIHELLQKQGGQAMVCRFDMLFYPGDEFTSDSMKLTSALKSAQSAAQPSPPYIPQPLVTGPASTTGPPSVAAPIYSGSRPSKALEDALYSSAQLLQQRPSDRRRIILILTDCLDEPKLNHHSREAVRDFLLQNNISVYALASGSAKSKRKFFNLTDYSSKTGGGIFYATSTYTMELTLTRMTEQARHDYTLVYALAGNNPSSKFHTLRVSASPGYDATTRSGYYTTSSDTPNP
jgi:VWFA-related protein